MESAPLLCLSITFGVKSANEIKPVRQRASRDKRQTENHRCPLLHHNMPCKDIRQHTDHKKIDIRDVNKIVSGYSQPHGRRIIDLGEHGPGPFYIILLMTEV